MVTRSPQMDHLAEELKPAFKNFANFGVRRGPFLPLFKAFLNTAGKTKPIAGYIASVAESAPRRTIIIENELKSDAKMPAVFWIHGGGHIFGRPDSCCLAASVFVRDLGVKCILPSYRVAPKDPFPADLDDCMSVWQWMLDNADTLGIDPQRVAIVGQSAGGGLAAAMAQRIHDEGGIQPTAQGLIYPMLDDHTALKRELDAERHLLWDNQANILAWTDYLKPNTPGDAELPPYAAPIRRKDLAGLPPAWIGVGTLDLFWEEDHIYAEALRQAGVTVELETAAGAPHGFDNFAPQSKTTETFWASLMRFLKAHL